MKKLTIYLAAVVLFTSVSCEKILMHPEPGTDNLAIFNEYAKICIEKFGLAEVKNIDLIEIRDSLEPLVTPDLSPEELFDLMAVFTDKMKEPHTKIMASEMNLYSMYDWTQGYPKIFSSVIADEYYYGENANPDVQHITEEGAFFSIDYGLMPQDQEIGYIRMSVFSILVSDEQLETMMEYLKDTKGLIIDIRNNFGGYVELASRIASYFTTEDYKFADNNVKVGPGPDDFAKSEMYIQASGSPLTYTKPVIILQDRISFSSGALFPIMMSLNDNVTTMGTTTGGGTGEIIEGFLSNGWEYILSTSNLLDINGNPTDNGTPPDIEVATNPDDTDRDAVIERAILELQSQF